MTEQSSTTDYEIRIPSIIIVRVKPEELYVEEDQTIDDALLAYVGELVDNPSELRTSAHDLDLDYKQIRIAEYQQALPAWQHPRELVGEPRTITMSYERVGTALSAVWAYVGRFIQPIQEAK